MWSPSNSLLKSVGLGCLRPASLVSQLPIAVARQSDAASCVPACWLMKMWRWQHQVQPSWLPSKRVADGAVVLRRWPAALSSAVLKAPTLMLGRQTAPCARSTSIRQSRAWALKLEVHRSACTAQWAPWPRQATAAWGWRGQPTAMLGELSRLGSMWCMSRALQSHMLLAVCSLLASSLLACCGLEGSLA